MTTYLYRAVSTEYVDDSYNGEAIAVPGSILGRQSGYLSRSSAVDAGKQSGIAYRIIRSEPIVFPRSEDSILRDIAELQAELARVRGGR